MEVLIFDDLEKACQQAADCVEELIKAKPAAVLGLASGATPLRLYNELVRRYQGGCLDFSAVTVFALDEYLGLNQNDSSSFYSYYEKNLFSHVNLASSRIHLLDGRTQDLHQHCLDYEEQIRAANGIDLQILGIGKGGHIGFNEPTSSLASRTRVKSLTQQTRLDNSSDFGSIEQVPQHSLTMGIATIMESRACLLLAFGVGKAEIIARTVEGPLSAMVPASILQMHPCVQLILDQGAAQELTMKSYFLSQRASFKERMVRSVKAGI